MIKNLLDKFLQVNKFLQIKTLKKPFAYLQFLGKIRLCLIFPSSRVNFIIGMMA